MISGSKIIITRKDDQRDRIGQSLRGLGADVINLELIQFTSLDISAYEWNKITQKHYQWLVFTSSNGVKGFFELFKAKYPETLINSKIAVFGERTAQTLEGYGYNPDIISKNETAVTLVDDLKKEITKGDKVLLLLGNLASNELTQTLSEYCQAKRLDIYKTSNFKSSEKIVLKMIAADDYDLIIITSPSSYESLKFNMQSDLQLDSDKVVCLGPTTENALAKDGILPIISAKPSDNPGLYELIEARLNTRENNSLTINKNT